jgi:2-polyprenyl-3-methyl-5-hydroxy-6-metoxy-1,4-benzoquinol methylase
MSITPPQQDVYPDASRDDVAPFIPAGARSVLEVGCGRGGFGRTLRSRLGPEARLVAVEAVPSQAEVARRGNGFDEVLDGYYPEALTGRTETFDAVFFIDVLEHVLDPWAMLERARADLSPGGRVVAAIPSIQYAPVVKELLRGRWDYADMGTLDRTHLRFFTRATMVEMFEGAGFVVERCEGVNSVWAGDWRERSLRRRLLVRALPQSEWLHYVIVASAGR